ncbi:ionic transporter y4hA [Lysobacter pythonis]|uniref:Ionic transporter y4hA n=1 Tax=Solilutibacter pythonis TaxID=2483112 RepID=A0A3M2HTT8_9GAMM|nr:ionic transporter y4hA [Lysobacter pythonis]RMH91090.1 ionic transporter y4hA [Lysobacter pythonis]
MAHTSTHNPAWTLVAPAIGTLSLLLALTVPTLPGIDLLLVVGLFGSVVAAVHHAEVIAHKVGEPFGTLVLALAVTAIEVALIVTMMLAGGESTSGLARDTVFAAVMLILNGIIGLSLLAGSRRHIIQHYRVDGVTAALTTLSAIVVLTLVLPNFTTSVRGPRYDASQLVFISVVTLVLFSAFTLFQTRGHRDYFLPVDDGNPATEDQVEKPDNLTALISLALLLLSLSVVVLSAKKLAPAMETVLAAMGAPHAVVGIVIAAIVLLPEGVAAVRAAINNRIQTSLNLAVGSAIASIGLTIPTVAIVALVMDWPLTLGLDAKSSILLFLTLFITSISLRTGKTNTQIAIVHVVLLGTYLFLSFVP